MRCCCDSSSSVLPSLCVLLLRLPRTEGPRAKTHPPTSRLTSDSSPAKLGPARLDFGELRLCLHRSSHLGFAPLSYSSFDLRLAGRPNACHDTMEHIARGRRDRAARYTVPHDRRPDRRGANGTSSSGAGRELAAVRDLVAAPGVCCVAYPPPPSGPQVSPSMLHLLKQVFNVILFFHGMPFAILANLGLEELVRGISKAVDERIYTHQSATGELNVRGPVTSLYCVEMDCRDLPLAERAFFGKLTELKLKYPVVRTETNGQMTEIFECDHHDRSMPGVRLGRSLHPQQRAVRCGQLVVALLECFVPEPVESNEFASFDVRRRRCVD
ncbi:hypothetical protein PHYSODRAFT_298440 [Phytophthora sojae]|uniref:Uncharacterized protein n=1 Tax=Phytophthora sojae (strain P6497) TaxID=1094619 RepID=G4Z576_PHYSP|nr:hypothetical protein PHYSODRAFT_298440 [Phytophthora sojae]EGZ20219.1 hypothetical protein PHYSODRAFT_298440 [Phytophthora sojae]|eukprot:XP_009522936.1 hypothetical protein PHYSODRAFT_298440 [Phytophthora sojae]